MFIEPGQFFRRAKLHAFLSACWLNRQCVETRLQLSVETAFSAGGEATFQKCKFEKRGTTPKRTLLAALSALTEDFWTWVELIYSPHSMYVPIIKFQTYPAAL